MSFKEQVNRLSERFMIDKSAAAWSILTRTSPVLTAERLRNIEQEADKAAAKKWADIFKRAGVDDKYNCAELAAIFDEVAVGTAAEFGALVSPTCSVTFGQLLAAATIATKSSVEAADTLYLFANASDRQLQWENLSNICQNLRFGDVYGEYYLSKLQEPADFMEVPSVQAAAFDALMAVAREMGVPRRGLQAYWEMFAPGGYCDTVKPPVASWCKASLAYDKVWQGRDPREFLKSLPFTVDANTDYDILQAWCSRVTSDRALVGLAVVEAITRGNGSVSEFTEEDALDLIGDHSNKWSCMWRACVHMYENVHHKIPGADVARTCRAAYKESTSLSELVDAAEKIAGKERVL